MSPRSFFVSICKLAGLYFILQVLLFIPAIIPSFGFMSQGLDATTLIFIAFIAIIYIAFCRLLLFKGDWIVDVLKLDEHFEEDLFTFNMRFTSAAMAILIIIAGVILIQEIPDLIHLLYLNLAYYRERLGPYRVELSQFVLTIIKIIIALLLIGERKRIANYLDNKEKEGIEEGNVI